MKTTQALPLFLMAGFLLGTSFAQAEDSSDVLATLKSLKTQMASMQETIDQQNIRIQELESRSVAETPRIVAPESAKASNGSPTITAEEWKSGIKDNIGKAIPWLDGAKFGGDFRLRAESFDYFDKNNDAGSTGTAADRSRNRFRIRLRWGFEKDYGDDWKVGFRLVTGSTTDQTGTNQTLGNAGYFTYKPIVIDRAYASYTPTALKNKGLLNDATFGAGKFENPFSRYSGTMVWDPDVTPEGLYEKANLQFLENDDTKGNLFLTAGQFLVNENTGVDADAEVYGYQGALAVSTHAFGGDQPVDFALATSFYDYTNWSQTVSNNTTGASFLRTNTIVADNFKVLEIYPEINFYPGSRPLTLWFDWAKNLANVGTEDLVQSGGNDIHDTDTAWGLGFKYGKAKKKGEWDLAYGYYAIGANAVVAAFNDSDFGGPSQTGFTNRVGHRFGLSYQLTNNITAGLTTSLVRPLNPSASVASSTNEKVLRTQADLVYKF